MGIELARLFVRVRGDSSGLPGDMNRLRGFMRDQARSISQAGTIRPRIDQARFRQDVQAMVRMYVESFRGASIVAGGLLATAARKATGLVTESVAEAGRFEQTQVAFEVMLGSARKAQKTLQQLTDFAVRTPFTLPGVEKSAQQLLAVGFGASDLLPILKSVGDVAAGIGRGEVGLERLILNLGQVKTQGRLTGRELRDFAVLGIPLLDELATMLGKTTSEIQQMVSQGGVSSRIVVQAFNRMSSAGGRFANLMTRQAETLLGMWSNFVDSVIVLKREIGQSLAPVALEFVRILRDMLTGFQAVIQASQGYIPMMLAGAAATATFGAAVAAAVVAMNIFGITARGMLLGTGIGAAVIALGAAIGAFVNWLRTSQEGMALWADISKELVALWGHLRLILESFVEGLGVFTPSITGMFRAIASGLLDILRLLNFLTADWAATWDFFEAYAMQQFNLIRAEFEDFARYVAASFVGVGAAASGLFEMLGAGFASVGAFIVGSVLGAVSSIGRGVSSVYGFVTGLFSGLISFTESSMAAWADVFAWSFDAARFALQSWFQMFRGIFTVDIPSILFGFAKGFAGTLETMVAFFVDWGRLLWGAAQTIVNEIVHVWFNGFSGISEFTVGVFDSAFGFIRDGFLALWEWIKQGFYSGDIFSGLVDGFTAALEAAKALALGAADDLMRQFTEGFSQAYDESKNPFRKAAEDASRKMDEAMERMESAFSRRFGSGGGPDAALGEDGKGGKGAGMNPSASSFLDAGRYSFTGIADKIQDALLSEQENALDLKRNSLLGQINNTQTQLLAAANRPKKFGLE